MTNRKESISPIRKILVPTDFSACSEQAARYAAMIAQAFKARVLLVHVVEPLTYGMSEAFNVSDHFVTLKAIAGSLLEEAHRRLAKRGIPVEADLLTGVPYREILQKSRRAGADLIVMGTHGRTGVEHFLLGSVAEKVVRLSSCPVVTVRSSETAQRVQRKAAGRAKRKAGVTLYG